MLLNKNNRFWWDYYVNQIMIMKADIVGKKHVIREYEKELKKLEVLE
jgi:hypothetical protein